jgi:hypothetical protein
LDKVVLTVLVKAFSVEGVFKMFESKGEVENLDVCIEMRTSFTEIYRRRQV